MTREIPSDYQKQQIPDFQTSRPIQAIDWVDLADAQNKVFESHVTELGSHIWNPRGETTTDSSFTQINGNTSRDADELNWYGIIEKEIASGDVLFGLESHGQDVDLRLTVENQESGSWSVQITNSHGGTADTLRSTATRTASDVKDSGDPELIRAKLEWKATAADPSTDPGLWLYARAGGIAVLSTSDLPTADATP